MAIYKKSIGRIMYKLAKAAVKKGVNWGAASEEDAINFVIESAKTRLDHAQNRITIDQHPKYIREKIKNMDENQLGYSIYGYQKASYFD